MTTVGIAILTLNAASDLENLLPLVTKEGGFERIAVIDSESTDFTSEVVGRFSGVEWVPIARADFNHGATREFARKYLDTDIVVFLTQDVIPIPGFLAQLVAPLKSARASVAYARQLPHANAKLLEAFPRTFNYPQLDQKRTIDDVKQFGVFTFFCSDSCSAYLNQALDAIGGIEPILTNEDYFKQTNGA